VFRLKISGRKGEVDQETIFSAAGEEKKKTSRVADVGKRGRRGNAAGRVLKKAGMKG